MWRSATLGVLVLALIVSRAPSVWADDATDREEAKQLRDRGVEAMNAGRYAEALEWFRHSYDRYPSAKMRYNIAVALDQWGHGAAAVEHYEDFLAAKTEDAPARSHAAARIAALESSVARLDLEVSPPEATVWIDTRPVPRMNRSGTPVAPGTVLVAAEHAGYTRLTLELTLAAGERRHVALALVPTPAPQASTGSATNATTPSLLVAPAPPPRRPLYKQGWFWGVVGGGAAVVAGAVAVSIVFATRDRYPGPTLHGLEGN